MVWAATVCLCIPDEYLAQNIAKEADVEVIAWKGRCEVHELFTAEELQPISRR